MKRYRPRLGSAGQGARREDERSRHVVPCRVVLALFHEPDVSRRVMLDRRNGQGRREQPTGAGVDRQRPVLSEPPQRPDIARLFGPLAPREGPTDSPAACRGAHQGETDRRRWQRAPTRGWLRPPVERAEPADRPRAAGRRRPRAVRTSRRARGRVVPGPRGSAVREPRPELRRGRTATKRTRQTTPSRRLSRRRRLGARSGERRRALRRPARSCTVNSTFDSSALGTFRR